MCDTMLNFQWFQLDKNWKATIIRDTNVLTAHLTMISDLAASRRHLYVDASAQQVLVQIQDKGLNKQELCCLAPFRGTSNA